MENPIFTEVSVKEKPVKIINETSKFDLIKTKALQRFF